MFSPGHLARRHSHPGTGGVRSKNSFFFFLTKTPQNKVVSASEPVYMRLGETIVSVPLQSQFSVLHWL